MDDLVTYERRGHLAVITLNRPAQLNALNRALVESLAEAWARYAQDDDAWIAILTGAGRAFCAGRDLKERAQDPSPEGRLPVTRVRDPFWRDELDKPTIAAVEGYAYGGGFFLAARTDLRVAGASARFQVTEVVLGLLAGFQLELTQNLPAAIAAELAAGEVMTAERAYQVGFVNRIVPDGQALAAAIEWAESILERPPLAIDRNLRLARSLRTRRIPDEIFAQARAWQAELIAGHDVEEAHRAFAEKRRPLYRRA